MRPGLAATGPPLSVNRQLQAGTGQIASGNHRPPSVNCQPLSIEQSTAGSDVATTVGW